MTNVFPKYAELRDKIALVMGIGQSRIPGSDIWGNGAAIERLLAHSGAKVFGCDLFLEAAEYTAGLGTVVNNASIAGLRYIGKPQVACSTAKAAVIHFTRVTAVMYAPRGVRMNSVSPGLVYTPLVEGQRNNSQEDAYWKIMERPIPIGRMGDAFDVTNATVFLASDAAKYITGQNLVVDGGFTSSAVSKL
ncbi:hypothetical protein AN8350.2 [Aspergillus nidulans FGSC A4]|nr:hypothetical protein AN8350.2 [Aspergillus nidulans FGSC A4]|eukprot:XP_681619.1 hypothetical protein AN8350.2 [Aspergillus nidulans FGSC A4]